jgi:hypothetical protein
MGGRFGKYGDVKRKAKLRRKGQVSKPLSKSTHGRKKRSLKKKKL